MSLCLLLLFYFLLLCSINVDSYRNAVSRSEAILNGSADTEVSDSAKAFQEQDKSKTRPKEAIVKKVITEDSLPEIEEDRLDHIAGIGGVKDLEATWSTPSPSTSKRVYPVSFSTLYIIYIYYII